MGKDVGTNMLKLLKPMGVTTPHSKRNAETQRQQMRKMLGQLDPNSIGKASPAFKKAFRTIQETAASFGSTLQPLITHHPLAGCPTWPATPLAGRPTLAGNPT